MGGALEGAQSGKSEEKGGSGKRKIVAQIIREMMAIDPERAMAVAKSWAANVQMLTQRKEEPHFTTLDEYLPFRCEDVGYG